jgi:hypothetical protein
MWLEDPNRCLSEMNRVLAGGGVLLASAEPDYGGLVEYPRHTAFSDSLESSLALQGADPHAGRKLGRLFRSAGLGTQVGVSATVYEGRSLARWFEANRGVFYRDLEKVMSKGEAEKVLADEEALVAEGKMLMVPLFWAMGFKRE